MQPSLFPARDAPSDLDLVASLRRPDVTVAETLPAFERYLTGARKAPQTVSNFSGDIRQFADMYPRRPLPLLVTTDLQLFLGHLRRDRELSDKTITRKITSLKSYFRFLVGAGIVPYDAASRLIYPTLQPQLPEILTDEEVAALLQATEPHPVWHALVATLRYAGPKREEALALQRTDITLDAAQPTIALRRRRPSRYNRDRTLTFQEPLHTILHRYLAGLEGPYLFPLHVRSVHWGLSYYGAQAGIRRPISAQVLRDTFAVAWLRSKVPSEAEAERLGLREAYAALVAEHDRQLMLILGLAENTAPVAIAKYRRLAQPVRA